MYSKCTVFKQLNKKLVTDKLKYDLHYTKFVKRVATFMDPMISLDFVMLHKIDCCLLVRLIS